MNLVQKSLLFQLGLEGKLSLCMQEIMAGAFGPVGKVLAQICSCRHKGC